MHYIKEQTVQYSCVRQWILHNGSSISLYLGFPQGFLSKDLFELCFVSGSITTNSVHNQSNTWSYKHFPFTLLATSENWLVLSII